MKNLFSSTIIAITSILFAHAEPNEKHLFILAGQSNMAGLKHQEVFQPMVEQTFGKDNVIIIKEVESGQSILRWYAKWDKKKGGKIPIDKKTGKPGKTGDVYDRLLVKLKERTEGKNIKTITFCWMQGESDTYKPRCNIYKESFLGIIDQLKKDLKRKDINVVIGRISDARMHVSEWKKIRQAQVELADMYDRWAWINTDDCNDGINKAGKELKNDLHYSVKGYKMLGQRFADESIKLIKKNTK